MKFCMEDMNMRSRMDNAARTIQAMPTVRRREVFPTELEAAARSSCTRSAGIR